MNRSQREGGAKGGGCGKDRINRIPLPARLCDHDVLHSASQNLSQSEARTARDLGRQRDAGSDECAERGTSPLHGTGHGGVQRQQSELRADYRPVLSLYIWPIMHMNLNTHTYRVFRSRRRPTNPRQRGDHKAALRRQEHHDGRRRRSRRNQPLAAPMECCGAGQRSCAAGTAICRRPGDGEGCLEAGDRSLSGEHVPAHSGWPEDREVCFARWWW